MQKARSRLATTSEAPPRVTSVRPSSNDQHFEHPSPRAVHVSRQHHPRAVKYIKYLPLLLPAMGAFAMLWYLLNHFYPAQLANIPVAGSFGPVLLPFAVGTFFLLSFALLNSRVSFILTLVATTVLFLRLQGADL